MRCCRRRCSRELRRSCAIWRPPAGIFLQRTRCVYFRDTAHACNKREPGSGCSAIDGHNRTLAILGTSKDCIATNPSDQNVALTALEATIQIQGVKGERSVPIHDFYLLPGSTPDRETVLEPGDLITSVTLPPPSAGFAVALLETSRSRGVRVCACFSGGCRHGQRRKDRAGAGGAGWSRHQAVAVDGGRARAGRPRR